MSDLDIYIREIAEAVEANRTVANTLFYIKRSSMAASERELRATAFKLSQQAEDLAEELDSMATTLREMVSQQPKE